jgi:hypothetical protein
MRLAAGYDLDEVADLQEREDPALRYLDLSRDGPVTKSWAARNHSSVMRSNAGERPAGPRCSHELTDVG